MNNYSLSLCDFGLSQFYPQNFNCHILIPLKVWIKKNCFSSLQINKFCILWTNFQLQLCHFFIRERNFTLT